MTSRHDPDLPWETSQRRDDARHGDVKWWRDAVCYQVYLRSFADGNGDGVGDLAGLRRRLPYLSELGVDAVWVNPWHPSPMADGGYDVTDYRAIDPTFGSLAEARTLIEEIHALGLRILIDLGPFTPLRAPLVQRGAGRRSRLRGAGSFHLQAGPRAGW